MLVLPWLLESFPRDDLLRRPDIDARERPKRLTVSPRNDLVQLLGEVRPGF